MTEVYCKTCNCILWKVSAHQSIHDKYHDLKQYLYCPNCKKLYGLSLSDIQLFDSTVPDICAHRIILPKTRTIPRTSYEVIEFNETKQCQIIIPKAMACCIEISGSENYIKVKGEKNIVTYDKQLFS